MSRGVRAEIMNADMELSRFVRAQVTEYERLGYPKQAAFAKLVSRGTHQALTPDDPVLDAVGRWFWGNGDVRRRVIVDRYASPDTDHQKATRVSMSVRRMYVEYDRLLSELSGFLGAVALLSKKNPA